MKTATVSGWTATEIPTDTATSRQATVARGTAAANVYQVVSEFNYNSSDTTHRKTIKMLDERYRSLDQQCSTRYLLKLDCPI